MGIEFELKYRATPAVLEAIAKAVGGQVRCYQMHTTYYDTYDRALSRRHYTLRRRMENGIAVCTLKTPAGGLGRKELELQCDTIEAAIPELCKLSDIQELPILLAPGVEPVCGAKFSRRAITLEQNGCTVELALDVGVLTGGGKEQPLCELEVELKAGSRQAAADYAAALAAGYGLEPEPLSKFRRAYLLAGEV